MKIVFLIAGILASTISTAQKVLTYYNWNWKETDVAHARFYSEVTPSDTVWKRNDFYITEGRLQMSGFYKDKDCKIKHGVFAYFHANGVVSSHGMYADNKKLGLWYSYHSNGMMQDSTVYSFNKPTGTALGWFPNGGMSDSSVYSPDGWAVKVKWFDNGQLSSAGREQNEKQQGKWQYFNLHGKLAAEEVYDAGKLINRVYYNEDGTALSDTSNRDREATSKKDWKKYLEDKLYFPANIKIVNSDQATVVVNFAIDEEGNIVDAYVSSSFHRLLDEIALSVIKNGPKWIPAIDHNRHVKAYRRQPLTFSDPE